MPRLEKALTTMLDSMLSGMVLGQSAIQIERGSLALAASKVTGRTLATTAVTASSVNLLLDSIDQDGAESDPDSAVEIKVGTPLS